MLRVALFIVFSVVLLPLSWRSLRNARAHGFYRFFAFELLMVLILLNAPVWFRAPFCARQWAAWCIGVVSIGLAVEGFRLLRVGKPGLGDVIATNLALEGTTRLITTGAYRWIRHPLYASLLALALCAYLKDPLGSWSIFLTVLICVSLWATAITEEQENIRRFGSAYTLYMQATKRFVPYVF